MERKRGEGSGVHALGTGGATRKRAAAALLTARRARATSVVGVADGGFSQARPVPTTRSLFAPGPVASPECPSPTDSEVKRKVPSSMNASWKPLSCPFMVVLVVSDSDVEEGEKAVRRRQRRAQAEDKSSTGRGPAVRS